MKENSPLLLIDDEPDILEAYKMMLEENGYSVYTAGNKNEALEILEEYPIAVCLIDLKMGNENGLQVSRVLNKADSLIKNIIITAYPAYDTAVDAIKMGIFDYVSKTVDPRILLEKIEKALEVRRAEIASKNGNPSLTKKNLILVCNHNLIRGGIENFCRENPPYHLLHSYHSINYIKHSDFNLRAVLLLLCMACFNPKELKNPEKLFSRLKVLFPNARLVMINCHLNDDEKITFLKFGVKGFLPGSITEKIMQKAFDLILKGQLWVNRELTDKLLNELTGKSFGRYYRKPANWNNLSKREVEILQAMASGLSNLEISENFFISENTVKVHISRIFKKLNVKSRTQAVIKAQEAQVI